MCALSEVLTISEVAEIWQYSRSAVIHHVNKGHFRWRFTRGGQILVEKQSVSEFWGEIPYDLAIHEKREGEPKHPTKSNHHTKS